MKIILTLDVPNESLAIRLKLEGMTVNEFKTKLREAILEDLDAGDICAGARITSLEYQD